MQNTLSQGYAFLAYLYAGVVLGVAFTALRLLQERVNRRAVTHLCDAAFALLFAAIFYTVAGLADSGAIRLYGVVTLCLGAALQWWAFGRTICKRIVKRRR